MSLKVCGEQLYQLYFVIDIDKIVALGQILAAEVLNAGVIKPSHPILIGLFQVNRIELLDNQVDAQFDVVFEVVEGLHAVANGVILKVYLIQEMQILNALHLFDLVLLDV